MEHRRWWRSRWGQEVFAVLAERLPEELDDEIKRVQYQFHKACGRTTAEQIREAIPLCLPKANLCKESRIPGISVFDFKKHKELREPTLLKAGWIKLTKIIAQNNPVDLSTLITLCDDLAIQNEKDPSLRDAMLMSKGKRPLGETSPAKNTTTSTASSSRVAFVDDGKDYVDV